MATIEKYISGTYSKELNECYTTLNAADELVYVKLAKAGNLQARDRLVKAQIKQLISVASIEANFDHTAEELVAEGVMGIISAIDSFDITMGNRFSTYSIWYIRHAMQQCVNHNGLLQTYMTKNDEGKYVRQYPQASSLDVPIGQASNETVGSMLINDSDSDNAHIENTGIHQEEMVSECERFMQMLTEKERIIVTMHDADGMSFADISLVVHKSRQACQVKYKYAMSKMRKFKGEFTF
jgi:RNA polymerase sigma factor (sigma-70 family)